MPFSTYQMRILQYSKFYTQTIWTLKEKTQLHHVSPSVWRMLFLSFRVSSFLLGYAVKKTLAATSFSIMNSFGSYFQAMLLTLSQQMLKNVATPQFLDDFRFCPFSCLHFAETSCKKRNGYTFVWSNNKDNIEKMSAIYGFHDSHW